MTQLTLTIPGLDITPTGVGSTTLTHNETLQALGNMRRVGAAWRWVVGDLVLNLVDGDTSRLHEAWQQISELDIDERPSLMQSVAVAHAVPHARRIDALSWSHHKEVALMDGDEQTDWLARAVTNGWSVRELHEAIADEYADDEDPQPELPGVRPWADRHVKVWREIGAIFESDPDARVVLAADGTMRVIG